METLQHETLVRMGFKCIKQKEGVLTYAQRVPKYVCGLNGKPLRTVTNICEIDIDKRNRKVLEQRGVAKLNQFSI